MMRRAVTDDDKLARDDAGQVARRLRRMLRPWRWRITLAVLCLVGQTGCLLAGPALVAYGIDSGIRGNDPGAIEPRRHRLRGRRLHRSRPRADGHPPRGPDR